MYRSTIFPVECCIFGVQGRWGVGSVSLSAATLHSMLDANRILRTDEFFRSGSGSRHPVSISKGTRSGSLPLFIRHHRVGGSQFPRAHPRRISFSGLRRQRDSLCSADNRRRITQFRRQIGSICLRFFSAIATTKPQMCHFHDRPRKNDENPVYCWN